MFDYLFKFATEDEARRALPNYCDKAGWIRSAALETTWFHDDEAVDGFYVLIAARAGDDALWSRSQCLLELDRRAAKRGDLFIRKSRLPDNELQGGYFIPAFQDSDYPRPLIRSARGAKKPQVWRP
jgi:hypothetical protein